jgi:hypothetical protein
MSKKLIQAAAGAAGGESIYVEDVFSTHIYDGNQTANTITNGIDFSGEGGLLWIKSRTGTGNHVLMDTVRGANDYISSNTTSAEATESFGQTFNSDGFTINTSNAMVNDGFQDYVSWSFRKQAGFFDVKTFTAESDQFVTVNHDLSCNIGAVVYKETNGTGDWNFWHKSFSENDIIKLNTTAAKLTGQGFISQQTSSSARFFTDANTTSTYVAYFFGDGDDSNAQSFGDNSDEAIIKCGSYLGSDGADVDVNLGFEPQWLMIKNTERADTWTIIDSMRGLTARSVFYDNYLAANSSAAEVEGNSTTEVILTATGFTIPSGASSEVGEASETYIYIAIRRPMKTPEAGTEVFKAVARSGNSTADTSITCGFPLDWVVTQGRNAAIEPISYTRLQSNRKKLKTYSTTAEGTSGTNVITSFDQDGMTVGTDADINSSSYTYINWFFKRAAGYFDVIAYTGNSSARALSHNLGVAPELIFFKTRSPADSWLVASTAAQSTMFLNTNAAESSSNYSSKFTSFTASAINLSASSSSYTNETSKTYIALMFATLAGVSKCGIYTGTGAVNTIDCGFSAGARFVMIKSRDNARDWFIWDHARGIVSGNDPYQTWNNAGSETTSTDYIDPENSGFQLSGANDANQSGEKYIFLAIA